MTYTSRSTGNFPLESGTETVTIESETTGFTLAVLGVLPLSRNWELFGTRAVRCSRTTRSRLLSTRRASSSFRR